MYRWAELTDPLGGKERVHFGESTLFSDPPNTVPTGLLTYNFSLAHETTLYWDKQAMAMAPGQQASAMHWTWARVSSGLVQSSSAPISVKKPLENRVWYNYVGGADRGEGTMQRMTAQAQVLDDGATQLSTSEYNSRGLVTKQVDPLGRETVYEYAPNGLDVVAIKQKNGGSVDVLETRTYNSQHLPLTVTDASGQTTTYTYNAAGQTLTVTNAKEETTTYAYDTNGYLTSITGPVAGATTTFTYDGFGRVRAVTDSDGYTVTTDYDAANRVTRTTYPDTTFEETTYTRLDPTQRRDRLGRVTRLIYDAVRRLTATRDPLGRVVTQEWCTCGSLNALIDANGSRTRWERDVQGRVTKEMRADGRQTRYAYETTTSRLKSMTDAKDQVTTSTYFLDDKLKDTRYTNAQIATPNVSFTYDTAYGRLATMVDGTGTTTYGYHAVAPPALGAATLASVDGPLPNDTMTYSYDELGRVTTRAINGVGVTWTFDALGRVTTEANSLGTFTDTYEGTTHRIATVTYPNGQTSTYSYLPHAGDHRLQTIHHRSPGGSTLSKFDYTYNAVGNILTWRQQADAAAVTWSYGYDPADQLVSAIKRDTDPQQPVLTRHAYTYDPAGNRTAEQIDDLVTGATYNEVNELVSQQPSGAMQFSGTVNEPATVTVATVPATVSATNEFQASVPVASGANTVAITARDSSGNTATQSYQLTNSGSSKSFTYDANGNLTADGTRTFEWDARNQLVAVNLGTHRSEFSYDGQQRRVQIVEKENGATQSDTKLMWCDGKICEERAADGITVTRRAFQHGEQIAGAAHFFAEDHLGSVDVVTDTTSALLAGYTFDPWGRRTLIAGNEATDVGFTAHRWEGPSGLWLTLHRAYDPDLGRWINEDPIRFDGGTNFYGYVAENPVKSIDPFGLAIWVCSRKTSFGVGNHAYFWNDKNGSCCGTFSTTSCKEGGPKTDTCRKVPGSDGLEEEVLRCCRGDASNSGWQYRPLINDCQTNVHDCLSRLHLQDPGVPGERFGCRDCDQKKK